MPDNRSFFTVQIAVTSKKKKRSSLTLKRFFYPAFGIFSKANLPKRHDIAQNFDAILPKKYEIARNFDAKSSKIYEIAQNLDTLHQPGGPVPRPVPPGPTTSYAYDHAWCWSYLFIFSTFCAILAMNMRDVFQKKELYITCYLHHQPHTVTVDNCIYNFSLKIARAYNAKIIN